MTGKREKREAVSRKTAHVMTDTVLLYELTRTTLPRRLGVNSLVMKRARRGSDGCGSEVARNPGNPP